ncbi:MAG: 4Fe-4S dicluster domain-containing protein [Bacillota bacterium]|jgi:carbon-monoxide dehydrogenase iron sulfur subunit
MEKMIVMKPMECAGCRTCEMVCSVKHYGVSSPVRSQIRVVEWLKEGLCSPLTCLQCEEALCEKACPMKAISRDNKTGAKIIDEKLCVGCRMCVLACPVGGTAIHLDTRKAMKCDLCGGDPQCVRFCPTGAIEYVDVTDISHDKKKSGAALLLYDVKGQMNQANASK